MDSKVSGVGPHLPPKNALIVLPKASQSLDSSEPQTESAKVETVSDLAYPFLFSGLRQAIEPVERLRKFIELQKTDLGKTENERFYNAVNDNSSSIDFLEELVSVFNREGFNFETVLKHLFVKSDDFEEKAIIMKMLFSLDLKDLIINGFIIPVLESKSEDDINHIFCIKYLNTLTEVDLENTLRAFDLSKIHEDKIHKLAASLALVSDIDTVFQGLLKATEALPEEDEDDRNILVLKLGKAQKTVLAIMDILDKESKYIPVEILRTIYQTSVSDDITKDSSELLLKHHRREAVDIFRDQMFDDSLEGDLARRRRFYAIGHYSKLFKEHASKFLEEFMLEEKDLFLAAHACYALANNCELSGKQTLINAMAKQIRERKVSMPLSALLQMARYGNPYLTILKSLLTKKFEPEGSLTKAFENLSNENICTIQRDENNTMILSLVPEQVPELVIDLVEGVGLRTFIKWVASGDGKASEVRENFKNNASAILDYAWKVNKSRMSNLFLETLSLKSEKQDLELLRKLAGQEQFGKSFGENFKFQ